MSPLTLHRLHDDDGISLVEIMVAIVILGVAMSAFASTLVQSLATVTRDEQLVRANQFAADLLEGTRSLEWQHVGFYSNDPGYVATANDGAETVTLGATRPAGSPAPRPDSVVVRDGITYTVEMDVVWFDDPNHPPAPLVDPDPHDYKELRVTLDWTAKGIAYETSSVSVRQPTTEEVPLTPVPNCTPGTITDFDVSPDFVLVSASGNTLDDITVTVSTCTPVSQVRLYPVPLADFNMTVNSSSGNTFFSIDPFRAGVTQFNPGTYTWRAVATSTAGTFEATSEVQFVRQEVSVLQVRSLSVNTNDVLCVQTNRTYTPTTLTARISGAGNGDVVRFTWTSQNGNVTATFGSVDANGNGVFSATVPNGHRFNRTTSTVSVSVTRTSDGLNVTESYDVPVVAAGALINGGPARCPNA